MTEHIHRNRLASGAIAVGIVAGLITYASLPMFQRYVAGVMATLSGSIPLEPQAPGLVLSLAGAFLIGLSMNFLPCNIPIVMTLLPATSGAESRGAFLGRTGLYTLGAISVLGTAGFVLGWAGATLKPLVLSYPQIGVVVAGVVLGAVGLISIGWGLRELGVFSIPTISLPYLNALRNRVDQQSGASEYVLLGAVYGGTGGGCPMPTYHLLLVWIVVAANALFGAVLLGTYVLGRVLPVAILGAVLRKRPTRAAELFGGRYGTLRQLNGVVLTGFGSLLLVFAGLRALVGGG
ncbi:MAG: cytochrome c biogenesis protein CcdA [Halobacteriales archaeon]|nr:cytochrome c biogenesis protein CcdA [Halobacteriales archaeon]